MTITTTTVPNIGGYTFVPQSTPHRCPNCGACPNCGWGGKTLAPFDPWVQPWPGYPKPYVGDPWQSDTICSV